VLLWLLLFTSQSFKGWAASFSKAVFAGITPILLIPFPCAVFVCAAFAKYADHKFSSFPRQQPRSSIHDLGYLYGKHPSYLE
jgi:hypothetical protein